MSWTSSWLIWALLSAMFAALTAIFAKVGVEKTSRSPFYKLLAFERQSPG